MLSLDVYSNKDRFSTVEEILSEEPTLEFFLFFPAQTFFFFSPSCSFFSLDNHAAQGQDPNEICYQTCKKKTFSFFFFRMLQCVTVYLFVNVDR